jgi:tetratricopeptide (TPR) repeat protein
MFRQMTPAENDSQAQAIPSLRELMRTRRPHLFSDSLRSSVPEIAREVLDYHLETLTKRKQEYQFEHFARLLAESELCPNLRPQTGPTGGGDSKVDTETYPVAQELSERWYAGDVAAGHQRWAFAFSAKEKWAPKVKDDVDNIVASGRTYDRIFFITSRYAPDKQRALLEDKLSQSTGVGVTILDRSWILEKIYGNDRIPLAVEALGLTPTSNRPETQLGPTDAARLRRLAELDAQITDPTRYEGARYSLAEDCLNSALLARGLERNRHEVEARFAQARRIADEVGIAEQRFRILYLQAWTAHWWYEDLSTLLENYATLEVLARDSQFAENVEKLLTMWQLLGGACARKLLDPVKIGLQAKHEFIGHELERLASDASRPNNALQAKFALGTIAIHKTLMDRDEEALDEVWRSLLPLVAETEALLSFPLERTVSFFEDLSEWVPRSEAYEELLDAFLPILERRRSDVGAGQALMRRGLQKLEDERYDEAIRLLGRAELRLAKQEETEALVVVMQGLGRAYLAIGLPWAARTKFLFAVERGFAVMHEDGDIDPSLVRSLFDLVWTEIRLGRIPHVLTAWRHFTAIAGQLEMSASDRADLDEDFKTLDAAVGYLLARADAEQLSTIRCLPDVLGSLKLPIARMLLLWALGHEAKVRADYLPPEEADYDLEDLLKRGAQQPIHDYLPAQPQLGDGDEVILSSRALGCEFRFEVPNSLSSTRVAEALTSALESFLSTSLDQPVLPYRERVRLKVRSTTAGSSFEARWHDDGPAPWAELIHPDVVDRGNDAARSAFNEWLRDFLGNLIARSFYLQDAREWLQKVAGGEEAFSRAIALGNVPIISASVFGDSPSHSLGYWLADAAPEYPPLRPSRWTTPARPQGRSDDLRPDTFASVNHANRRVASIINLPLWDAAKWSGTGSAVPPPGAGPPVLALSFRHIEPAAKIFEEWRERLGQFDEDELIRVAIIQGIRSDRPAHYAVTISRAWESLEGEDPSQVYMMLSRIQRMEAASRENLERFLEAYAREGYYALAPMRMKTPPSQDDFRYDLAISKRKLDLRQAWEIGPDDPDLVALRVEDDPIIPPDVAEPPVRAAKERLRQMQKRSAGFFPG